MAREVDYVMGRPGTDKILMYRSEDWLRKKFMDEKLSVAAISGLFGVSSVTIYAYLNKYDLKVRKRKARGARRRILLPDAICCNADCRRPFKARKDQHLKYSRCPTCQIKAESIASSYF